MEFGFGMNILIQYQQQRNVSTTIYTDITGPVSVSVNCRDMPEKTQQRTALSARTGDNI